MFNEHELQVRWSTYSVHGKCLVEKRKTEEPNFSLLAWKPLYAESLVYEIIMLWSFLIGAFLFKCNVVYVSRLFLKLLIGNSWIVYEL